MEFLQRDSLESPAASGWDPSLNIMAFNPGDVVEPIGEL